MDDTVRTYGGKHVFGIIILIGIAVGTGLGLIIGTSPKIQHISVFDVVIFHPTPASMALYGALAATIGLTMILGIVLALSRFDQSAV
ncbi:MULTISPECIES: hypothetical protein [Halobacteriales]|jgi:hypothetical protein|uniref:DUF7520 family protein n=1 Tax=Halobacteriales TaxID=2235 RepID=UPI000679A11F|nr:MULTISPECIES: hypothetical protein [Halobacteria]MDT3436843.1 hypothetical protein [Haloarcula sp. 1CSR25-25]